MADAAGTLRFRSTAILKPRSGWRVLPNLTDYDQARAAFSWEAARLGLDGLPGGAGLNIAHEAVDRHASGPRATRVALRVLPRDGGARDFTYADLRRLTNRFANVLQRLGVGRGEVVASVAGRVPELYIAALGTLKAGAVFSPLFSAFGPEPIQQRLALAKARVLVTTPGLYARKVSAIRDRLPALEHVLLIGAGFVTLITRLHDRTVHESIALLKAPTRKPEWNRIAAGPRMPSHMCTSSQMRSEPAARPAGARLRRL